MRLVVRLTLFAAAWGLLVGHLPDNLLRVAGLAACTGVLVVNLLMAHSNRYRPWTDAGSWLSAGVALSLADQPAWILAEAVQASLGVVFLVMALHVPSMDAPRVRLRRSGVVWLCVAVVAFFAAWWAVWTGEPVRVADPATSVGVTIRLALVAVALAVAALGMSLIGRGRVGQEKDLEPRPA